MSASGDAALEHDLEWLSLEDDEEIVWVGGPDRRTLLPTLAIGIPLSIVLIGILLIVGEYLRISNTVYVITDSAVYRKTGVLSRDVKRIDHEKVQDISYSQSALGSTFGYGTVELTTAGGAGVEMAFRSVPEPRTVQQRISEQVGRHRDPGQGEGDVLEEILTELRAIRAAVEESDDRGEMPDIDDEISDIDGEGLLEPDSDAGREAESKPAFESRTEPEPDRREPVRRRQPPTDDTSPTDESPFDGEPSDDRLLEGDDPSFNDRPLEDDPSRNGSDDDDRNRR
ncbi:PH domain-containing protein [Natronococcus sp. A-GB1]|uniref:PH domain-containing protein n=1 Tax=Natronococcus sp. A-GB1 TaxID=3037648 RepID=UPI00241EE45A|nr:PH domain-containing protein [Natronococcus sp. A-GB1]MDG5760075.1 PH domain-containing protein [Natronococcus sp. A-GB1]